MTWTMSEEVAEILHAATKKPLIPSVNQSAESVFDREAIQAVLPHRDPFLFLDRVTQIDFEEGFIAARHDLSREQDVLAGHFPNHPVWPGVLQVEAIGQAGIFLMYMREGVVEPLQVTLTHIAGARFIRPILPGSEVEIQAKVLDDTGLLFTVAGQCIQGGEVCSVAVLTNLYEGGD
jgi:3-hydroxyacyl-[acyl-carrier-protein] dehydratase